MDKSIHGLEFPKYITIISSNSNCNLSILPPENKTEENKELYGDILYSMTRAFIEKSDISKYFYPISNYLEYLYLSYSTNVKAASPNDYYTHEYFIKNSSDEFSDYFKSKIKNAMVDHFGSEKEFEKFLLINLIKVIDTIKEYSKNTKLSNEAKTQFQDIFKEIEEMKNGK